LFWRYAGSQQSQRRGNANSTWAGTLSDGRSRASSGAGGAKTAMHENDKKKLPAHKTKTPVARPGPSSSLSPRSCKTSFPNRPMGEGGLRSPQWPALPRRTRSKRIGGADPGPGRSFLGFGHQAEKVAARIARQRLRCAVFAAAGGEKRTPENAAHVAESEQNVRV